MRDRYRHWYDFSMAPLARPARPIMAPQVRDLEDLVLKDLAKAETESEKLEILDSYSLACQRKYRGSMQEAILDQGQSFFVKILRPILEVNLPDPQEPYHPKIGMAQAAAPQNQSKQ